VANQRRERGVFQRKKLIDAVYRHRYERGALVPELLEYRALTEFNWTQRDFDRADLPRLMRVLSAAHVDQVLEQSDGGVALSDADSALLGRILAGRGSTWRGDPGIVKGLNQ
jgi:hypothetical protein